MRDFGFGWGNYVSVTDRRLKAQKAIAKLRKQGRSIAPVAIEGRNITKNFWGKSWCSNLERYSDIASRLPRGRSYVCNGLVVDLQITKGRIAAKVSGSKLYDVAITIAAVGAKRWRSMCCDCAGSIDSLVELLQGRLAQAVMDRVCRDGDGLFPAPEEIKFSCTCPDWADMCKHVAATLYGVGARLDEQPQLLFALRGVDEGELLAGAGQDLARTTSTPDSRAVLETGDIAALFELDMVEADSPETPVSAITKPPGRTKMTKTGKSPVVMPTADAQNDASPLRIRSARAAKSPLRKKHGHGRVKRAARRSPGQE
jgi:uncharacterized Zn finger protein